VLTEAMAAGGDEAERAFGAMMEMKKIDVAAIAAAAGWAHRCVPLRRTRSPLAQTAILWVPPKLRLSPPAPDD
jgi:hypothetical protein